MLNRYFVNFYTDDNMLMNDFHGFILVYNDEAKC